VEQEPFLAVRCAAVNMSHGYTMESHSHPWHQLLCAWSGAMTVFGGRLSWIVPPGKAVLIPAGTLHSIRMWGEVAGRSLYFLPSLRTVDECRVISVTPLLREMVDRVIEWRALDTRIATHQAMLTVLLYELSASAETQLSLLLPVDRRALAVARHLLDCPSAGESIDEVARLNGASKRTLERLFRSETGLSVGLWRQKARLLDSVRTLAEGASVTTVALESGYASLSAFIAAFRKTFGYTPGAVTKLARMKSSRRDLLIGKSN
jgi:AraC-like DNA-binding protein